jgi:hypothetical protein
MDGVFISYRRLDSSGEAGRLSADLRRQFRKRDIFIDVADMVPGAPISESVHQKVSSSSVLLVLIGDKWLSATDDNGHRRIDDPADWVHQEIALALKSVNRRPTLTSIRRPRLTRVEHRFSVESLALCSGFSFDGRESGSLPR